MHLERSLSLQDQAGTWECIHRGQTRCPGACFWVSAGNTCASLPPLVASLSPTNVHISDSLLLAPGSFVQPLSFRISATCPSHLCPTIPASITPERGLPALSYACTWHGQEQGNPRIWCNSSTSHRTWHNVHVQNSEFLTGGSSSRGKVTRGSYIVGQTLSSNHIRLLLRHGESLAQP